MPSSREPSVTMRVPIPLSIATGSPPARNPPLLPRLFTARHHSLSSHSGAPPSCAEVRCRGGPLLELSSIARSCRSHPKPSHRPPLFSAVVPHQCQLTSSPGLTSPMHPHTLPRRPSALQLDHRCHPPLLRTSAGEPSASTAPPSRHLSGGLPTALTPKMGAPPHRLPAQLAPPRLSTADCWN
jgi:hypothetical protein